MEAKFFGTEIKKNCVRWVKKRENKVENEKDREMKRKKKVREGKVSVEKCVDFY